MARAAGLVASFSSKNLTFHRESSAQANTFIAAVGLEEAHGPVKERGAGSEDEERPRATIRKLRKSSADTNKDLARARADVKALVRAVNLLTAENQELRAAQASHGRRSTVVPFPGTTQPRPRD
jgi:hypothetical protein